MFTRAELGSVPADAAQYKAAPIKQLMKQLHETNVSLSGFSNVNKKARDQYVSFTDQQQKLKTRRAELDVSSKVKIFALFGTK